MNTQSLNLPEDLGYTTRHVWARKDGDTLVIGIRISLAKSCSSICPMRALPSEPMTNSGRWNP